MDELLKHILLEFQIHNEMLNEEHGRIPHIQQYIYDLFENAIIPMEIKMKKNKSSNATEKFEQDVFPNCKCFFTHFNIEIKLALADKKAYSGGYYPQLSFYTKTSSLVVMKISVTGKDFNDINSIVRFVFAHELAHAYDDCCRTIHYGTVKSKIDIDANYNNYYNTVTLRGFNTFQDDMCTILNYLSPTELKAFIGQFEAEIKPKIEQIKDAKSAWMIAKETDSWNKLVSLEKGIAILNSLANKPIFDKQREMIVIAYNNIYPSRPITTYDKLLKLLNRWLYKFKRIYINRISKILYDLFSENDVKIP